MNRIEERRYNRTEFRVVKKDGEPTKIVGYASVFNSDSEDLGGFTEQIDPKAFDAVLASKPDVRALWNHNPDIVLGRTVSGTLRLKTDKNGLAYEVDLPDTQAAKDLSTLMQRGDVNQSSFGFIPKVDQWTENEDGSVSRRILEMAELFDVSPVTYPAYPSATSGVRSYPTSMPVEIRSKLQKRSDEKKTKKVDGEDLTADCFLIVGDPDKTDTWHLPWKFSTDEKTKSHLRDALARFDQVEGVSKSDLDKAWAKLVKLCKEYGIEVNEEKSLRSSSTDDDDVVDAVSSDISDDDSEDDEETDSCKCDCAQCVAQACNLCSNDYCDDEMCSCYNQSRSRYKAKLEMLRLFAPKTK